MNWSTFTPRKVHIRFIKLVLCMGCSPAFVTHFPIEEAVSSAIRLRMMNSLQFPVAFYESSPPLKVLKESIESGTISVTHITDGGIKDALFRTLPKELRIGHYAEFYPKWEDELRRQIDFVFEGGTLEYELAAWQQELPKFKDAARFKIDIDMEASRYHLMFDWIVFEVQAVVSGNSCLMFVFGNTE